MDIDSQQRMIGQPTGFVMVVSSLGTFGLIIIVACWSGMNDELICIVPSFTLLALNRPGIDGDSTV